MSVACPRRHLSYATWRSQVFRSPFCPCHPQSIPLNATNQQSHLHHRAGNYRNFTACPVGRARKRPKRGKNGSGYDEDAFAILEEAAKRTTSPQLIDPSTSLRSNPPSSGVLNQKAQQSAAKVSTLDFFSPKERTKKAGKTPAKTKKQNEEQEAAAFLEEATKRVTDLQVSGLARSPAISPENTANLKWNTIGGFESTSDLDAHPGAPLKTKKQIEGDDASASLKEATKRVTGVQGSYLPRSPAMSSESTPDLEWNTVGDFDSIGDPDAYSDARLSKPITRDIRGRPTIRDISSLEIEAIQEQRKSNSPGKELQNWFKEAVARARKHEENLQKSALDHPPNPRETPPPVPNVHETIQRKVPRPLEPWTMRAPKAVTATEPPKIVQIKRDLPHEPEQYETSFDAEGNLKKPRNTVDDMEFWNIPVAERATEPGTPSIMGPTLNGKPELPPVTTDSSMTTKETIPSASADLEQSNSNPVSAVHKRTSGVLSTLEHEQLSVLLSSLQSKLAQPEEVPSKASKEQRSSEQRAGVESVSETLPSSPYQRLQAQERRMKEQATAEAKQRLQDNPWAQWLASPVRMCQATGVRLPNKLMVGWNYVRNPKDAEVYLMPEELSDMAHLGSGNKSSSPSSEIAVKDPVQEVPSSGSAVDGNLEELGSTDVSASLSHSADTPHEQARGDCSIVQQAKSNAPRRNPPIAPAKIYLRPSSILLLELNNRMLSTSGRIVAKDDVNPVRLTETNVSAVNRLLPNRWKEQARKFEQSANSKSSQAGFLTTQQMRKVRWHPNIHDVMLNLLRSRVLKALESVAVRNNQKTGMHRRVIPLPCADSAGFDETAGANPSGVEQAVFMWLGNEESFERAGQHSQKNTHRSSSSSAISPSTYHGSTLRFVPRNPPAKSDIPSSETTADHSEEAFIPIWTQTPTAPEPNRIALNETETLSQRPQQYIPPSITLHLPFAINNADEAPPINRNLPVFSLPTLLGQSSLSKLRTLAKDSPALRDAFGLNTEDGEASGWVLVKGGKGTQGFKSLVQEVWRLWLFLGGRRGKGEERGGAG